MTRKMLTSFVWMLVISAFWLVTPAQAGVKWHQNPDLAPTGMDVSAFNRPGLPPFVLADDFQCIETGPITEVHIYGSWWQDSLPFNNPDSVWFVVSFHEDIPADVDPGMPWSHPGELLYLDTVRAVAELHADQLMEGWFEPPDHWDEYGDSQCWRYIITFDEPFIQEGTSDVPVIYWIDIQAIMFDPGAFFGWKTSIDHWNDDACWTNGIEPLPAGTIWNELRYTMGHPFYPESIDLAFTIFGPDEVGACCYEDPPSPVNYCIVTTEDYCVNTLGGVYQGDGTVCGGMRACCLASGDCIDADSICCVNEIGGTPQDVGTTCGSRDACCLPDGSCVTADSICCVNMLGGSPQGWGSVCTALEACCLPDGSCTDLDPLCCIDLGGSPQGQGTACTGILEACCLPDGSCLDIERLCCDDVGGILSPLGAPNCLGDGDGDGNDDACVEPALDTCEYYKPGYPDYAPNGVPDFDQKQNAWMPPLGGGWSHCGPVALANCFWWFDSKFETNQAPPPTAADNYPLVTNYNPMGLFDDHLATNVMPFVDSLAKYCNTNGGGRSGTQVVDLYNGALAWLAKAGLSSQYTVNMYPVDPAFGFEGIRGEVLRSQNVILLLGFWHEIEPTFCERVGGHYVTVAGVCTGDEDSAICISDPMFDVNEGEPPAGSAHGSAVHNDASLVSGPHGTIHHDRYDVTPSGCAPLTPPFFTCELVNYAVDQTNVGAFAGQNAYDTSLHPIPPQPLPVHTIIEFALIICPVDDPTGACCVDDPTGGPIMVCTVTTQDSCEAVLGGIYQGDGTLCGGIQACCMPNGDCVDADSICCVNELGGTPQGDGTHCTAPEACCMTDGTCQMLDPLCCLELDGVPQGPTTTCTTPEACCFNDGSCQDLDPLCCDEMGGYPTPHPGMLCQGDHNGNDVDDACDTTFETGACCFPDGHCEELTAVACAVSIGTEYKGDGTHCLGDANHNTIDDACDTWRPGDPHKMHFPQLPDPYGWDVKACDEVIVADDWRCGETGWVKDIHFWGSWMHGDVGQIRNFVIRIYEDIPADTPGVPYSRPGALLWEQDIEAFNIAEPFDPPGIQGWYDPMQELILPDDHIDFFQYNIYLREHLWFWQNEGNIYWLAINAVLEPGPIMTQWGWKSSTEQYNDDGTWSHIADPAWRELRTPPEFITSMDLSFVITGDSIGGNKTGACCMPDSSCTVLTYADCMGLGPEAVYQGHGTTCLGDNDGSGFDDACECCGIYTGGITGNANCSSDGKKTLSDITRLIDRVYISKGLLCCDPNGNTNGSLDELITLSDITRLIDEVYISRLPTAPCL